MKRLMLLALSPLLLSACETSGQVPTYGNVGDITNLYGVPAAQAQSELAKRGYRRISRFEFSSVWWNDRTSTCAGITMSGGSVSNIQSVPASSCFK